MPLFTIVSDFKGGTYLDQVKARGPNQAYKKWCLKIDSQAIIDLGAKGKKDLINRMIEERPVYLDGLKNVWCCTGMARDFLALVHIVQTES